MRHAVTVAVALFLGLGFCFGLAAQEVSGLGKVTKEVSCLDRAASVDSRKKKMLNIDKLSLETQLLARVTAR